MTTIKPLSDEDLVMCTIGLAEDEPTICTDGFTFGRLKELFAELLKEDSEPMFYCRDCGHTEPTGTGWWHGPPQCQACIVRIAKEHGIENYSIDSDLSKEQIRIMVHKVFAVAPHMEFPDKQRLDFVSKEKIRKLFAPLVPSANDGSLKKEEQK